MKDQGMIIAKRAASLSKTYLVIGVGLMVFGVLFFSLSPLLTGGAATAAQSSASAGAGVATGLPFIGVSFQALSAILFSTPVLMLFVYDKNNGVLEYLLSLGMNQRDIYRQYLKAALILAGILIIADIGMDVAIGILDAVGPITFEVAGLVAAVGLATVSLGTILMMSFSSLQKQRVGSNQPLGMAIGSLGIFPTYFLPVIFPSSAFVVDLAVAGIIAALALLLFSISGRLISREKLLP